MKRLIVKGPMNQVQMHEVKQYLKRLNSGQPYVKVSSWLMNQIRTHRVTAIRE